MNNRLWVGCWLMGAKTLSYTWYLVSPYNKNRNKLILKITSGTHFIGRKVSIMINTMFTILHTSEYSLYMMEFLGRFRNKVNLNIETVARFLIKYQVDRIRVIELVITDWLSTLIT